MFFQILKCTGGKLPCWCRKMQVQLVLQMQWSDWLEICNKIIACFYVFHRAFRQMKQAFGRPWWEWVKTWRHLSVAIRAVQHWSYHIRHPNSMMITIVIEVDKIHQKSNDEDTEGETPMLMRRCWCANPDAPMLMHRCWCAQADTPMLMRWCWCANADTEALMLMHWWLCTVMINEYVL